MNRRLHEIVSYPDREAWLASRTTPGGFYIGASEVAAVLGVSPFSSPFDVWAKHKAPDAVKAATGAHLDGGTRWEDVAARLFELDEREAGRRVIRPQWDVATCALAPWLRATPDAFIFDGDSLVGVWECKTIRFERLARNGADGVEFDAVKPDASAWPEDGTVIDDYGDDVNGPVPIWMFIQTQAQMFATGTTSATLEAWFFGFEAPEVRRVTVLFDAVRWAAVLEQVTAWRDRYLLGDDIPEPGNPEEAMALAKWRWPVKAGGRAATDAEVLLIAEINRCRAAEKAAKDRSAVLRAELAESMGPAGKVWSSVGTASFNKNNALTVRE